MSFLFVETFANTFIPWGKTKQQILYKNYTYSFKNPKYGPRTFLRCSKQQSLNCTSHLRVESGTNRVLYEDLRHNHEPPTLYVTPTGKYIKASDVIYTPTTARVAKQLKQSDKACDEEMFKHLGIQEVNINSVKQV
ncbi:hypothetical protein O0L34_g17072 [Tuta absoluta]|nr:hypothetical protein O0L34_g17072 [Tuta absoluta]